MRILFICPYPQGEAPSQRFRFEQYLRVLEGEGHTYRVAPFMDYALWFVFYRKGYFWPKFGGIWRGYVRRFFLLFGLWKYDVVFIHRETSPIGPPIYSWIICKLFRKRVIFDFDDAIWIKNHSHNNRLFAWLKQYSNSKRLMKWSGINSCGNEYLRTCALKYNPNSVLIPTTIDTDTQHNRRTNQEDIPLRLGWTGTHSTVKFLDPIVPVLQRLSEEIEFEFVVISDVDPKLEIPGFVYKKWNKSTEIEDLLSFQIGLMPLMYDEWSEGKCGLKALQYMALGIVPIVSPIGVNVRIVEHEVNGIIAHNDEEWFNYLKKLLTNHEFRRTIADRTRNTVVNEFSVKSTAPKFLDLFAQFNIYEPD